MLAARATGGAVFAARVIGNSPKFPLLVANDYDILVAQLDVDGGIEWGTQLASQGDDMPTDVALDANGDVFVVGNVASGTLLTKLSGKDGKKIWARQSVEPSPFGTPGPFLAVGPSEATVSGMLGSPFDFGNGTLDPGPDPDVFVVQYAK